MVTAVKLLTMSLSCEVSSVVVPEMTTSCATTRFWILGSFGCTVLSKSAQAVGKDDQQGAT